MKRVPFLGSLLLLCVATGLTDPVLTQSFESRSPLWQAGNADAPFQELQHDLTNLAAHSGQKSEHIRIQAEQGTYVYYYYPLGRASFFDDFRASVWVKANRPGMQLLVRLVLPKERDAKQLDQPLTTLLRGDTYQLTGRWEELRLRDPSRLLNEQKQLLRAEFGRDLNFEGVFADQVIVNILGGPGLNEVWLDDLEVSPVVGAGVDARTQGMTTSLPRVPVAVASPGDASPTPRNAVIELSQDRLLINKQPFVMRGVRHANSSMKVLRQAGFNTLWLEGPPEQKVLAEAVNLGFWLVPEVGALVPGRGTAKRSELVADLASRVKGFPQSEAVLAWQVGQNLTAEESDTVGTAVRMIRSSDPYQGRPVGAGLWDGFRPYSRQLDLMTVHRYPLFTGLEFDEYWDWLESRGNLSGGNQFLCTWVQTHTPAWLEQRLKDQAPRDDANQAAAPQPSPEQIRLLTYTALGAGCRGLAWWLDRPLTDEPADRVRFLSLALLNQELQHLEPMLATVRQVNWTTPNPKLPELRLALLRFEGGLLAIPIWLGKGAQYVPSQMAMNNLTLTVPGAPQDAQAWEVTPVVVRPLQRERVPGGMRITLPEFGLTTALLFTADLGQIGKLQQSVALKSKQAAQWSYDLALEQMKKTEAVDKKLADLGHGQPSAGTLLADARQHLQLAHQAWQRGAVTDYRTTYEESQRALRPMRILMRLHWQRAVSGLDFPTTSPFALAFETLPAHWRMVSDVRGSQAMASVLADGDFEANPTQTLPGWALFQTTLDGARMAAERIAEDPKQGRQCLKLTVAPGEGPRPVALERTFLAIKSPAVQLNPGTLVRISAWIKIPDAITASSDGVLFYDSCGEEPLAIRLKGKTPWRQFSLYRRVPESGEISLTLGLSGLGTVYFDDVRIEPLVAPREPPKEGGGTPAQVKFDGN